MGLLNRIGGRIAYAVLAGALLLGLSTTASAALILQISDGTTTKVIADGSADDTNPTSGSIVFLGPIGVWSVNVSTGLGSEILGSPNYPQIDLNSVNVSTAAGTLSMFLADTDLTSTVDPLGLTFGIGGTTQGSVSAQGCFDALNSNTPNACGGQLSTVLGPFTGGAFSGQTTFMANGTSNGPFALKIGVVLNHTGAGVTSFDANLNSVPEPSTLLLSGLVLVGLGLARRRFGRS